MSRHTWIYVFLIIFDGIFLAKYIHAKLVVRERPVGLAYNKFDNIVYFVKLICLI